MQNITGGKGAVLLNTAGPHTGSFIALQAMYTSSNYVETAADGTLINSSSYAEATITWGNASDTTPTLGSCAVGVKIPIGSIVHGPIYSFKITNGTILASKF